jgi:hypothetical protein
MLDQYFRESFETGFHFWSEVCLTVVKSVYISRDWSSVINGFNERLATAYNC